jgi:hypothetical protein
MTILDKVKMFLTGTNDISLGYSEINFIQADNLDDEQIGYSVDTNGNSLITGNDGDWQEEWLVIATDNVGDPIIVDVSTSDLTVLSAEHGEGDWEPLVIADSLEKFKNILSYLSKISKDRTNPVELENNPISDKEIRFILTQIEEQNSKAELSYWETFFEND